MRNYFPKRPLVAQLSNLSNLYDAPVGCVSPSFETVYCYICGRRWVAVARYRMICLVLLYFVRRYSNSSLQLTSCEKYSIQRITTQKL